LQSQFSQLREKLKVIAQTAALSINTADLAAVPLEPSGVNSPVFQKISGQLSRIKMGNPGIRYIYIMAKTEKPGVYQFVVDPDALNGKASRLRSDAMPGSAFDARPYPEMLKAFDGPSADTQG
jgi:hypothetical protein